MTPRKPLVGVGDKQSFHTNFETDTDQLINQLSSHPNASTPDAGAVRSFSFARLIERLADSAIVEHRAEIIALSLLIIWPSV